MIMKKQPEISIIIPVYNGATHLRRCIDSVFACGFEDIEILLIDDGSTDGSSGIMEEYGRDHADIVHCFFHDNMGVARTRNKGIDLAQGKYILFLDQDDWFDRDYISTFYQAIENSGSDVVFGGYKRPDTNGHIASKRLLSGKGFYQYIAVTAWAKIHRAAFIRENGIGFFDNNIGEDVVFCMQEAAATKKISFIPYMGYNWYFNEKSVSEETHRGFRKEVGIIEWMVKTASLGFCGAGLKEYSLAKMAIYYLLHSGKGSTPDSFFGVYKTLFEWLAGHVPGFEKNHYLLFGLPGETIGVRLAVSIFITLHRMNLVKLFSKVYCWGGTEE